jgi:ribosomal protein RSM22 (predicted rRNA methylase)
MIIGGDRVPSLGSGQIKSKGTIGFPRFARDRRKRKRRQRQRQRQKKFFAARFGREEVSPLSGKERNAEVTEEKEPVLVPLRTLRQFPS